MSVCSALYQLLRALLKPRVSLMTENLALRQQLVILRRNTSRPGLRNRDRLFWVVLSHLWRDWRSILIIVKPETVSARHIALVPGSASFQSAKKSNAFKSGGGLT